MSEAERHGAQRSAPVHRQKRTEPFTFPTTRGPGEGGPSIFRGDVNGRGPDRLSPGTPSFRLPARLASRVPWQDAVTLGDRPEASPAGVVLMHRRVLIGFICLSVGFSLPPHLRALPCAILPCERRMHPRTTTGFPFRCAASAWTSRHGVCITTVPGTSSRSGIPAATYSIHAMPVTRRPQTTRRLGGMRASGATWLCSAGSVVVPSRLSRISKRIMRVRRAVPRSTPGVGDTGTSTSPSPSSAEGAGCRGDGLHGP